MACEAESLPELAGVHWRPLVDERRLSRTAALWTATTTAHVVPFLGAAAVMGAAQPPARPVPRRGGGHGRRPAARVPGQPREPRPRVGDPRALRAPRRERRAAQAA